MEAAEWIKGAPSAEQSEGNHLVVTLVNSYPPSTGDDLAGLTQLEDEYAGRLTAIAAFFWEFDTTAPQTFLMDADWKLLWTGSYPSRVDSVIQGIAAESLDLTKYAVRSVEAAVDPALAAIDAGEYERALDSAALYCGCGTDEKFRPKE